MHSVPIQTWIPTLSNLAMAHQRGPSFINWPNDSNAIRDKIFFVQYRSLKNKGSLIRHSYDHCQSYRHALAHFWVVSLHSHPGAGQKICVSAPCVIVSRYGWYRYQIWDTIMLGIDSPWEPCKVCQASTNLRLSWQSLTHLRSWLKSKRINVF